MHMAKILDSHFRSPYFRFVYIIPANSEPWNLDVQHRLPFQRFLFVPFVRSVTPSFNFRMEMIREKTR